MDEQIKTLIQNQKWIDKAITADEYPDHDFYIPIGSLMNVLKFENKLKSYFLLRRYDAKK